MEIHEITKGSRRTDEGILDGVKKAVSAAKTGYNAAKAVSNTVVGAAKTSINKASAGYDKWADAARAEEQHKQQEKINRSVEKSTAALRRQGYDVNPADLPLSAAGTKANIAAGTAGPKFREKVAAQQFAYDQKIALQKFMAQFQGPNMPSGSTANTPATTNPATTNPATATAAPATSTPTKKATPARAKPAVPPADRKRFKQIVNQFGKQPTPPQPPRTTDDGGTVQDTTTGRIHTSRKGNPNARRKNIKENGEFLTEIYDIQKDFPGWIDKEIPGLAVVRKDPTIAKELDAALAKLVAAQGNPTALQSAFASYYSLASQAVKSNPQGNTSDAASANPQFDYVQNDTIRNLKLDPKIVATLKQKLDNREITPNALIDYIKNYSAY